MREITGHDLKLIRVVTERTTQEMAKDAGVKARRTYEMWEKGKGTPNVN